MGLVRENLPNMIGGVSQQAFTLRAPNQHTKQVNYISSPTIGLAKRPGTEYVAELLHNDTTGAFAHPIEKDRFTNYIVLIGNGGIRVFDLDGNEKTVTYASGADIYLSVSGAPELAYTVAEFNDYSLIVNKEFYVQWNPPSAAPPDYQGGLVWVRSGNYDTTYTVELNSPTLGFYSFTHTTGAAGTGNIQTNVIAGALRNSINANANWHAWAVGNTVRVKADDGNDFTITARSNNDQGQIEAINKTVETTTILPDEAYPNMTITVEAEAGTAFGRYYLQWQSPLSQAEPTSNGKWVEIRKPGAATSLNAATLPHKLTRLAGEVFHFEEVTWQEWDNGDTETNPFPSFLDKPIEAVFPWNGRLGIMSNNAISVSRPNDFFNFSRYTSTGATDADPIDVEIGGSEAADLRHALPYGDEVILFSDYTQYLMSSIGSDGLSAKTISINPFASYQLDLRAPPIRAGNEIFVALPKGANAGVLRLSLKREGLSQTLSLEPSEISEHVPYYIPAGVFGLQASDTYKTALVLSAGDPTNMWVYRWYQSDGNLVQSAWSRAILPHVAEIRAAIFIRSQLYVTLVRDGNVYLEKLHVDEGHTDAPGYPVMLDAKLLTSDDWLYGYDSTLEATAYDLPYPANVAGVGRDIKAIATGGGSLPAGTIVPRQSTQGYRVYFKGDTSGEPMIIGYNYEAQLTLSPLVLREASKSGQGSFAITSGRLQLRNLQLNFDRTGFFKVRVTPKGKDSYEYTMTGMQLNNLSSVLGAFALRTGTFRVPVMANNLEVTIEILNNAPVPCSILNIEWEAFYSARAQRYG